MTTITTTTKTTTTLSFQFLSGDILTLEDVPVPWTMEWLQTELANQCDVENPERIIVFPSTEPDRFHLLIQDAPIEVQMWTGYHEWKYTRYEYPPPHPETTYYSCHAQIMEGGKCCYSLNFLYDVEANQFIPEVEGMWEEEDHQIYLYVDETVSRYDSLYDMISVLPICCHRIRFALLRAVYRKWSHVLRQLIRWLSRFISPTYPWLNLEKRRLLRQHYRAFRATPPPYATNECL